MLHSTPCRLGAILAACACACVLQVADSAAGAGLPVAAILDGEGLRAHEAAAAGDWLFLTAPRRASGLTPAREGQRWLVRSDTNSLQRARWSQRFSKVARSRCHSRPHRHKALHAHSAAAGAHLELGGLPVPGVEDEDAPPADAHSRAIVAPFEPLQHVRFDPPAPLVSGVEAHDTGTHYRCAGDGPLAARPPPPLSLL